MRMTPYKIDDMDSIKELHERVMELDRELVARGMNIKDARAKDYLAIHDKKVKE